MKEAIDNANIDKQMKRLCTNKTLFMGTEI